VWGCPTPLASHKKTTSRRWLPRQGVSTTTDALLEVIREKGSARHPWGSWMAGRHRGNVRLMTTGPGCLTRGAGLPSLLVWVLG
jgi:xanthine/CO dehydrogenase XdhC/CoxF family maturation factor